MKIRKTKCGFTLIEFLLSIVTLFLLLIITYPILQEYNKRSQISSIKQNLNEIRQHSNRYFNEHTVNSVSLFQFVGPRKAIPELKIIADEVYPKTIYREEDITAYSEKFGFVTIR